jgi:hypothetical protein
MFALNDTSKPYHMMKDADTELIAEWKAVDADSFGVKAN